MPFDSLSTHLTVPLRSWFDDHPVVEPRALAMVTVAGRPRTVGERVTNLLDGIELKYGAWSDKPEQAAQFRRAFEVDLTRAFMTMPVVLASPIPGVRYAVVSGPYVRVLQSDGFVLSYSLSSLREAIQPLLDSEDSAFHWDRDLRPLPVKDDKATAALTNFLHWHQDGVVESQRLHQGGAVATQHLHSGLHESLQPSYQRRKDKHRSSVSIPTEISISVEAGKKLTRAVYAAGSLCARYSVLAARGYNLACSRLFDPQCLKLAHRTWSPSMLVYWWLIACDKAPDASMYSVRRRQFCQSYPELVSAVLRSVYDESAKGNLARVEDGVLAKISEAVDNALPLKALIAELRQWPSWVEKSLRGRLHAKAVCGRILLRERANSLVEDLAIGRLLGDLGPAWRPQHGDYAIMASLSLMARKLGMPSTGISALCPSPGGKPSPWKRAWRKMVPVLPPRYTHLTPREMSQTIGSVLRDAVDGLRAFEEDVVAPIAAYKGMVYERKDGDLAKRYALGDGSLFRVLEISREWHSRLEAFRVAKQADVPAGRDTPAQWTELFSPFSHVDSRLEIRCILNAPELTEHGKQMSHCVGRYAMSCLESDCHIVGFFKQDEPVATASVYGSHNQGFRIGQMSGHHNDPVSRKTQSALDTLVEGLAEHSLAMPKAHDTRKPKDTAEPPRINLDVTGAAVLETALNARQAAIGQHRTSLAANYDTTNVVVIDRVLTLWRFAFPGPVRAAWERARTPEDRVDVIAETLVAKMCSR